MQLLQESGLIWSFHAGEDLGDRIAYVVELVVQVVNVLVNGFCHLILQSGELALHLRLVPLTLAELALQPHAIRLAVVLLPEHLLQTLHAGHGIMRLGPRLLLLVADERRVGHDPPLILLDASHVGPNLLRVAVNDSLAFEDLLHDPIQAAANGVPRLGPELKQLVKLGAAEANLMIRKVFPVLQGQGDHGGGVLMKADQLLP
mmetsp:Transcript_52913/g.99150  ORF Transcript_52913/g.99150 Transcript_52913/m.99150 type:complete len:203 (+) Transcript_52913:421-1029(+)